jgi:hypothetical protein
MGRETKDSVISVVVQLKLHPTLISRALPAEKREGPIAKDAKKIRKGREQERGNADLQLQARVP